MSGKQILLNTIPADEALRVGSFTLMPVNPKPPIITSHPIRNIVQTTHIAPLTILASAGAETRAEPPEEFISLEPIFNKFTIRKGTGISWTMFLLDPSNINNPSDISNLKYVWKKDGTPIYNLNRENNNKGVRSVTYTEDEVTGNLSGEYVCEVSNEYGTTTTVPFILDILDTDKHPMIYSNLINNGDGDGGLDGWVDQGGYFKADLVCRDEYVGLDSSIAEFHISTGSTQPPPYPFRFNIYTPSNLFYPTYYKYITANPTAFDLSAVVPTDGNNTPNGLEEWEWWKSTTILPSIIANEDINNFKSPQGFYPGPDWIDKNNNNSLAAQSGSYKTLLDELDVTKSSLSLFTRNTVQFNDPIGERSPKIEQTINIVELAPLIERKVAGIDYLTGHFFAYVGLGISRYRVNYTYKGKAKSVNWYVKDLLTYRNYIEGDANSSTKINTDKGTPIEIEPLTDDTIGIKLEYLDSLGNPLTTVNVVSPTARDVWAVKEKVFFPLTLYPIIAFFKPNDNPITVFGTQYTTTEALLPLLQNKVTDQAGLDNKIEDLESNIARLDREVVALNDLIEDRAADIEEAQRKIDKSNQGEGGYSQEELGAASATILLRDGQNPPPEWPEGITTRLIERAKLNQSLKNINTSPGTFYGKSPMHPDLIDSTSTTPGLDKNAAFLLKRYGKSLLGRDKIYPGDIWEPVSDGAGGVYYRNIIIEGNKYKAVTDPGASAFFAVSSTSTLPVGTRLVRTTVTANNTFEYLNDDPKTKGWPKTTLFNTLFDLNDNIPERAPLYDFREPRCGITKMKFQVVPNSELISDNHVTYQIPPYENTVVGLAKNLMNSPLMDTSKPGPFTYTLIMPEIPQTTPTNVQDKDQEREAIKQYEDITKKPDTSPANVKNPFAMDVSIIPNKS